MVERGNTVRLTAQFKDWDEVAVDPTLIKLIIYDSKYTKLNEYIVGVATKLTTGSYYYDYVTTVVADFVYEWYAEIDGLPSLKRSWLSVSK